MKKEEFLSQLEYLLQDVKEEEKQDAIDYYRDYLEEAGPENEEQVLADFGSPERIAAIIRTDLLGGMDKAGEITENGFEDQRFKTDALPAVRKERPAPRGNTVTGEGGGYQKGDYAKRAGRQEGRSGEQKGKPMNFVLKLFLIAVAVVILGPVAFALAMGVFGGAIGLGGALLAILLSLGILTIAGIFSGVVLFVIGIAKLFLDVWLGVLLIGLGLAFLGGGCLLFVLAVMFYGSFLPWLIRTVIDIMGRIFGKKNGGKKNPKDKEEAR